MKRLSQYYPLLVSLFPVFSIYQENINHISFPDMILPGFASLGLAVFLFFIFKRLIKNIKKVSIVTTIYLLGIFSYAHVTFLIADLFHIDKLIYFDTAYIFLWIIIFSYFSYLVLRRRKKVDVLNGLFSYISVGLIIFSLLLILSNNLIFKVKLFQEENKEVIDVFSKKKVSNFDQKNLPDIYYLIFDRYASDKSLRDIFSYDNSRFSNYLVSKGFYVAQDSLANYPRTAVSLASSLNMEYVDSLVAEIGESSRDYKPLYSKIQKNNVLYSLKKLGYQSIHFGSWWRPTEFNREAEINENIILLPELTTVLLKNTIFYPLFSKLGIYDTSSEQRKRIFYEFEKLAEVAKIEGPTFVFAHLLTPHLPYVFDQEGKVPKKQMLSKMGNKQYLDQLAFTNKKIIELVDKLLEQSDPLPIIILQSDEGPLMFNGDKIDQGAINELIARGELGGKLGILNAYFLPGVNYSEVLYSSITPVNTFRVIFNSYFKTELPLLPDRQYLLLDHRYPYQYVDVTGKVSKR